MFDAQEQDDFSQNGWQAALERAELELMAMLDAHAELEEQIELQLVLVKLLEKMVEPPE